MLWLVPACVIACIATFFLGYYFRGILDKIKHLEELLETKVSKPKEPETPKSSIIDPDDEVSEAIYAREQLMKKMNP